MSTQQDFINEIYTIIKSSVAGINIFDTIAAQNEEMPYIVFQIISDVPKLLFKGSYADIELQVNIYDEVNSGVSIVRAYSDQIVQTLNEGSITVDSKGYGFDVLERGVSEISDDQSIVSIRSGFRIR